MILTLMLTVSLVEEQSGGGEIRQETSQQQNSVRLHRTLRPPEGAPGPQTEGMSSSSSVRVCHAADSEVSCVSSGLP